MRQGYNNCLDKAYHHGHIQQNDVTWVKTRLASLEVKVVEMSNKPLKKKEAGS